ncbi:MAG TPA: hypothetical protein VF943_10780 [Burkholderiales bacterium]
MRSSSAAMWTLEKIDTLTTAEIKQLRVNAERLNESAIATLCTQVLGGRPRGRTAAKKTT